MDQRNALVVGLLLAGCARDVESEVSSADSARVAPMLGEPCVLSSASQVLSRSPRVFVELATLEGDLALIQTSNAKASTSSTAPRTFSQLLTDPRWTAISVHHAIAENGVRQTFPWDFESPRGSTGCPSGEGWEISVTPHVTVQSSVMVRIEVQILPTRAPSTPPESWHVPTSCGARTTLVLRDQQLAVISGFPESGRDDAGMITTLTPYVIGNDSDLERLAECKRNRSDTVGGTEPTSLAPQK